MQIKIGLSTLRNCVEDTACAYRGLWHVLVIGSGCSGEQLHGFSRRDMVWLNAPDLPGAEYCQMNVEISTLGFVESEGNVGLFGI